MRFRDFEVSNYISKIFQTIVQGHRIIWIPEFEIPVLVNTSINKATCYCIQWKHMVMQMEAKWSCRCTHQLAYQDLPSAWEWFPSGRRSGNAVDCSWPSNWLKDRRTRKLDILTWTYVSCRIATATETRWSASSRSSCWQVSLNWHGYPCTLVKAAVDLARFDVTANIVHCNKEILILVFCDYTCLEIF